MGGLPDERARLDDEERESISDSQIFYSAGCFTSTESILQFGQSLGSNKHRHHTSKIMRKKEIVVPPPYAISSMFHIECNLFCFC